MSAWFGVRETRSNGRTKAIDVMATGNVARGGKMTALKSCGHLCLYVWKPSPCCECGRDRKPCGICAE